MHHISTPSLTSLPSRIAYLKAFLNFTPEDAASLHAAKPVVAPLIPAVLDAVYAKLLSFDVTAASFVAPCHDSDLNERECEGTERPAKTVEGLALESSQIRLRKGFLKNYLVELVTADYDSEKIWEDLDKVGTMHSGIKSMTSKPKLRVEYIHIGVLLGYVLDILLSAVMAADLDIATKSAVLRAFNKVIWIQNDLFARHYITESPSAA